MAKISDLKLAYRVFMKAYPYRKVDWPPGARLKTPLSDARVAVVTTAAFFRPDQPPFDTSIRGGDYSYRIIPIDTDLSTLNIAHRSDAFDIRGITSDKNLALPLDHRVVDAPSDWFPIPATVAASEETGTPSSAVHLSRAARVHRHTFGRSSAQVFVDGPGGGAPSDQEGRSCYY